MKIIEIQMEKIRKEKIKTYEYFKNININNIKIDNNAFTALNLRKILGHNTRTKKSKHNIITHEINKKKFNYDNFEVPIIKGNKIIISLSSNEN